MGSIYLFLYVSALSNDTGLCPQQSRLMTIQVDFIYPLQQMALIKAECFLTLTNNLISLSNRHRTEWQIAANLLFCCEHSPLLFEECVREHTSISRSHILLLNDLGQALIAEIQNYNIVLHVPLCFYCLLCKISLLSLYTRSLFTCVCWSFAIL